MARLLLPPRLWVAWCLWRWQREHSPDKGAAEMRRMLDRLARHLPSEPAPPLGDAGCIRCHGEGVQRWTDDKGPHSQPCICVLVRSVGPQGILTVPDTLSPGAIEELRHRFDHSGGLVKVVVRADPTRRTR